MEFLRKRIIGLFFFGLALVCGQYAHADYSSWINNWKASPGETMLLPQYCWHQFDKNYQGPQYAPSVKFCGYGTNHICPGLLAYQRSQTEPTRAKRIEELHTALKNAEYTLRWIKNYPYCPLRADALQLQNNARIGLGMPPLLNETPPSPAVTQIAPGTGTTQGGAPALGSSDGQGAGQDGSGADNQLYPAPKIPPRDDSKIGMPGDPYCRFCPD